MSAEIDLKTIRIMLAIEKEGSLGKAANALYISQPALSQYIKRIEATLSYPLYYRDNGRCIPTEPAKILLTEGKALLAQFDDIINKLELVANKKESEIVMGWPTGYTVQYLNKILPSDSESRTLNLTVTEDTVENLIGKLLKRKLDFLLIPSLYYHPDLVYSTIRHEEFFLAAPKNHIANSIIKKHSSEISVDLSVLKDMPFITLTANPYVQFVQPLFDDAGFTPTIIFKCKNWNSSHALVEDGLGLAIVPYWFAENGSDNINYYRINSNALTYRVFACVHHKNQSITPEFQKVIDTVKDIYGDKHMREAFDYKMLKHQL